MENQQLPEITLSRSGKNVVVIMLDRAINGYIPYLFHEKPELREQFKGFTYFPNTLSYGIATNIGTPPLFGGYEYVPEEMDKRSSEKLVDKHDEALKVMPSVFYRNGFLVTACNPPYAGYQSPPDLSIFDEFPGMKKYVFEGSKEMTPRPIAEKAHDILKNKFFRYSLFRIAPVCLQHRLYDDGTYNCLATFGVQIKREDQQGLYKADGLSTKFLTQFLFLQKLPDFTKIISTPGKNTFFMVDNDTTHEPALLQMPDYTPQEHVDNSAYYSLFKHGLTLNGRTLKMETTSQVCHYHVNMAAMLQLGKWFDYLRSENLYDNTRIILVSDHGRAMHQLDDMLPGEKIYDDIMAVNPLLMVKDFNSDRTMTDRSFMTNGDVPTLAFKDLVEDPVNPYTGKAITDAAKHDKPQRVLADTPWRVQINNGNTFLPGVWLEVTDNVFDMNQWKRLSPLGK